MKKLSIALMVAFCGWQFVSAQIEVLSITPLTETTNKGFYHPKFSPAGDYLLLTGANFKGLTKYDLSTQTMTQLTDVDNAGYCPQISDGGKVVVFRDVEYKNNRRYTSIKSINLDNNKVSKIDNAVREQYPFTFIGGTLKIAKGNSIKSKRLANDIYTPVEQSLIVAIENQSLILYKDNKRIVLDPNGKGSYIWPSISPDQKHIVYMALHDGCNTFVCDIDGKNKVNLGYLGAPVWLGNDWIVGMEDIDDGHQTISSKLKAARIDGSLRQDLPTPDTKIAMYPTASNNAVAYEADGTIYVMKLQIR